MQILTTIVVISLFCNGLHIITRPGMLFEFVDKAMLSLIFSKRLRRIRNWQTQLYKPLLGCIKCMASVWGVAICLLTLPVNTHLILYIPLICISASALNIILYQMYD